MTSKRANIEAQSAKEVLGTFPEGIRLETRQVEKLRPNKVAHRLNIVAAELRCSNVASIAATATSSARENSGSSDGGESEESNAREVHIGKEY